MLPLVHYLPKSLQRPIVERFTIWDRIARPTKAQRTYYIAHFLNELELLDISALQELFPEAKIVKERFLGLVKSIVAVKINGARELPTCGQLPPSSYLG